MCYLVIKLKVRGLNNVALQVASPQPSAQHCRLLIVVVDCTPQNHDDTEVIAIDQNKNTRPMLALKKKREVEAKAKADEAARAKEEPADNTEASAGDGQPEKVSLLGIGGKKKDVNSQKTKGKKRSPGEIRIQKGNYCIGVTEISYSFCPIGVK